jgi:hypothetical protein
MEVDGINVVGCTAIARSGRRAEIRWRNLRRFFCSWDLGRDGAPRFDRADLRDRRVTMSLAGYWNDLFLGGFLDVIRRRIEAVTRRPCSSKQLSDPNSLFAGYVSTRCARRDRPEARRRPRYRKFESIPLQR